MKYIVKVDLYVKTLKRYKTIEEVFNSQKDAVEYIRGIGRLQEWESITLVAQES